MSASRLIPFLGVLAVGLMVANTTLQSQAYTNYVRGLNNSSRDDMETEKTKLVEDPSRICQQNPYKDALDIPLEQISERMDTWIRDISKHQVTASNKVNVAKHNHVRFFPFEAMATCQDKTQVGGRRKDTSKIVCGLEELKKVDHCVVYSVGGNNQWQFELDLLEKTPCEVHTFDCTGPTTRFQKPDNDRIHFHHVCLGTVHEDAIPTEQCADLNKCGETWTLLEMQRKLNHTRIDLFKIDIEGYEWPILESWPQNSDPDAKELWLPMQMLIEVHYRTGFLDLQPFIGGNHRWDFQWARDMVNLQAHLLRMGFVVTERDNNRACAHCTELTLVRSRCASNGAHGSDEVAQE